jgi:AraC-like DNA-binding protein
MDVTVRITLRAFRRQTRPARGHGPDVVLGSGPVPEAVREGRPVSWAKVAADLGYADQAHLIRDFRAAIGQTPAAYAGSQSAR